MSTARMTQGARLFTLFGSSIGVETPPPARPLNALVFDDEPAVTRMFSRLLGQRGCTVTVATDGQQAVDAHSQARAQGKPFDVLFLDLNVRCGLTGEDVFQAIHPVDPHALAVVCSGAEDPAQLQRLAEQGFFAHLPKPFELEALRGLLAAAAARVASSCGLPLSTQG